MSAIATSMITATGSALRAGAQPQDQSQAASAEESPFAILLAALSPEGNPAGDVTDAASPPDMMASVSSPSDLAGQSAKAASVPAAPEKSNTGDQMVQAVLATILNATTATPPLVSPSSAKTPEAAIEPPFLQGAPAATPADSGGSQAANAGTQSRADAATQPSAIATPAASAPVDPAVLAPSSAVPPPESGDNTDSDIADASARPPVSDDKASPDIKMADKSPAGPADKAQPEKPITAPDQDQPGADLTATVYAASLAAVPPPADQITKPQAPTDASAIESISASGAPGPGAQPAKGIGAGDPTVPSDDDDNESDPPALIDALPGRAGSTSTMPKDAATPAKPTTTPAISTDADPKPVASKQPVPDRPASSPQDAILATAQKNPGVPSRPAAQKANATALPGDGDDTKPVQTNPAQTDSTPVAVPAAAGAIAHAAPPPSQVAAIFDPSAIMAPHATSPAPSVAAPAASLEITNTVSDPVPDLNGFAVSIAARSLSGAKQFEIRLDPPELGRVDVRLSIDASGKTVAHMAADQSQTLDLLRKDAPTLTQALRDAGLDVSQNGLNFSLRGQDRQNGDSGGPGRKSSLSARQVIQATQAPAAIAYAGTASNARLDIHV